MTARWPRFPNDHPRLPARTMQCRHLTLPDFSFRRTLSASYIRFPGDDGPPWSYIPPTAPEPRQPTLSRGDLRASLLHGAEYLDAALDAQIEGDPAALLDALTVLLAIVQVAIDQISSTKYLLETLQSA